MSLTTEGLPDHRLPGNPGALITFRCDKELHRKGFCTPRRELQLINFEASREQRLPLSDATSVILDRSLDPLLPHFTWDATSINVKVVYLQRALETRGPLHAFTLNLSGQRIQLAMHDRRGFISRVRHGLARKLPKALRPTADFWFIPHVVGTLI